MKRALLSVSDKTGIIEFSQKLVALGYEILSTGGTADTLRKNNIPVTNVSDVTGFPECLDGRVKTLHPKIHAGILAIRENAEHMEQLKLLDVQPIDIVAINLYPFKQTVLKEGTTYEEAIENIDIGGPTMIRSAAKNHQDVLVIVDPVDYMQVIEQLENGKVDTLLKRELALKVFEHTSSYDTLIAQYLRKYLNKSPLADKLTLTFEKAQELRYGENPHQKAAFYREIGHFDGTLSAAVQLHGKELSFCNINDANGALDLLKEFDTTAAVAVKHANPCGVGLGNTVYEAYMNAYNADPVSIFGGIVALNEKVDKKTAEELGKIFLEIIIAPDFDNDALEILKQKQNIRLLKLEGIKIKNTNTMLDIKKVAGGLLIQDLDTSLYNEEDLKVVTDRKPTENEMKNLLFVWKIVKHTKSNGIALASDNMSVGIGPGQTNRITALELAIKYAGDKAKGSVMASDAFFPFDDCVEAAYKAGITAIIQPGGSIRDEDSIKKCNEYGIAMIFTGQRHFKH